ncbi:AI-2E family transporter [Allorhodopirellula solitaria]|uniref:AI-2 transport protein TqsA n=1 Tax=Allorhodopirellula solitaria TaxID=2527987 RepID=A0A5C5WZ05_9BACT|nr:AI-2E family transporter [Allorhodopirellula solitaria]TWT56204.1 AI-2 transport protein TqsA [Allorhodopirellula solitaria]
MSNEAKSGPTAAPDSKSLDQQAASDELAQTAPPQSRAGKPNRRQGAPAWAVIGIFVLLSVAGLAYAQVFLTPVILAFLLSLVFSPVRRLLERIGTPPGIAAGMIVMTLVGGLLLTGLMLITPLTNWVENAPEIGARLEQRMLEIRNGFGGGSEGKSVSEVVQEVEDAATPESNGDVQEVVVRDQSYVGMLATTAPSAFVQTILVLVLLFFILASGDMFYEKLVHTMPTFRDKRRAITIAHDVERKLSQYLMTISIINGGLGIAVGLAMWAFGMPNPFLFGLVAALFNYVPYIGAIGGSLLALVVGLLTFSGAWAAIMPAATYYLLTAIEGQFITPYFVGRHLKLNTVVVFISVTFWAWLWSVVGMLVAVPLLVTLRTFCEHIPSLEPYGDFLSARGAEVDPDDGGADDSK